MATFGAPEELFRDTARYYARFRPPYPHAALQAVAARFAIGPSSDVIDLGCGTGQIAIPLASRGARVVAIDPSAEMLAEGARAGIEGIEWLQADDTSFAGVLPERAFGLCTVGAAFHWMQRDRVLTTLDSLLTPDGGVALFGNELSAWSLDTDWAAVVRDVVREFLGPERRAGGGTYTDPPESHPAVLRGSAFRNVTELRFSTEVTSTADEIVGLQLSSSYASPALLGDRVEAFRDELTQRLLALSVDGTFTWRMGTELLIATR